MTDWTAPFRPEDFPFAKITPDVFTEENLKLAHAAEMIFLQSLADIANARFRELLKDAPMVYSIKGHDHTWKLDCCVDKRGGDVVENSARLICIEELK